MRPQRGCAGPALPGLFTGLHRLKAATHRLVRLRMDGSTPYGDMTGLGCLPFRAAETTTPSTGPGVSDIANYGRRMGGIYGFTQDP